MTPQEILDRIPTVQELLDHPRVRQTAESWNRSAVAGRLRSAIAEVGAEVARRTEPWQGMTAGELVEDLVRRIDPAAASGPTTAINATGRLFCDGLVGPPLPDAAIEAAAAFSTGYRPRDERDGREIASLTGAEAAWIGASHSAALAACLETYARDGPLVIARRDMGRLRGGGRIEEVCRSVGVRPREVGVAEGATPADYAEALASVAADAGGAIVYARRRETDHDSQEIVESVRSQGGWLLVDVTGAAPIDLREEYGVGRVSAASALGAGADLVLLCGDGLLGAPGCAVVLGKQSLLDELSVGPSAAARQATPVVRAMVDATAALFRDPKRLKFTHPLYELISAPPDNSRTRAERLAPQIAEHARVDTAEAVAVPADQGDSPEFSWSRDSWGISVRFKGESPERSRERLRAQAPSVFCEADPDRLRIDLRTVFPRQDKALVDAMA